MSKNKNFNNEENLDEAAVAAEPVKEENPAPAKEEIKKEAPKASEPIRSGGARL